MTTTSSIPGATTRTGLARPGGGELHTHPPREPAHVAARSAGRPRTRPSQMAEFATALEHRSGRRFRDYRELHEFTCRHFRTFWRCFLDQCRGSLPISGAPEPVCIGDECEHAVFFPGIELNYADVLLGAGVAAADAPALKELHQDGSRANWTRGELREQVGRLADSFVQAGVRPGDRVVGVMRNDGRAVIAALAATAVGATLSTASVDMGLEALLERFATQSPVVLLAHCSPMPADAGLPLPAKVSGLARRLAGLRLLVSLDGGLADGAGCEVRTLADLIARGDARRFTWPRFAFNHPLFVMFSSGTTGRAKCIVHGAGGTLLEHLKEHRLHTDLRPGDRLYFHTSCGWMMWNWQLSALASGVEIVTYDGAVDPIDRLWRLAAEEEVTVMGTSPAYLKMSEEAQLEPARLGLQALRLVLSTGAILYDTQFDWIAAHVKDVPVQTISGGTDIVGCFVLGHPDLPVRRGEAQCRSLGLDVQAWLDGRSVACVGELVCTNPFPSRPLGFLGDEDGARFHAAYFARNPGVWTHGDLVEFPPAGGARMHGRSDGVLNVRGIKIHPAEICRVLGGIAGIRDAMVVQREPAPSPRRDLPPDPQVVALLVLQPGVPLDDALVAQLRRTVADSLSPAHVPDRVIDVAALPVTHSGKASEAAARAAVNGTASANEQALRNPECLEAIRLHPGLRNADHPPRPREGQPVALLERLRSLWEEHLGVHPVTHGMNFFELGGNSLIAARVVHALKTETGRPVPLAALVQAPTLGAFAAVVEALPATPRRTSLVQMRSGVGRPVYVVHALSGLVMEWSAIVKSLHTSRPLWGVQARGIDGDEEPQHRVEDMAASYVRDIRQLQPDGPYSLCGFSLGGTLAYEMACQLRRAGQQVDLLGLVDPYLDRGFDALTLALLKLASAAQKATGMRARELPRLAGDWFARWIEDLRQAQADGRRPRFVDQLGLAPAQRRVYEAMCSAHAAYHPPPCPAGPVLLLAARPPLDRYFNSSAAWRRLAPQLELVRIPGGHHDVVGRNASLVAAHLDAAIERCGAAAACHGAPQRV